MVYLRLSDNELITSSSGKSQVLDVISKEQKIIGKIISIPIL